MCLWGFIHEVVFTVVHSLYLLSSIPLYEYPTVCLPTTTLDEHSGCFQFEAIYE